MTVAAHEALLAQWGMNRLTLTALAAGLPLFCACAPLSPSELAQQQPSLFITADDGNDLVFASNSNVPLHLRVSLPLSGNALRGNVTLSAGRGGDSIQPHEASIPGSGDVALMLHVGGPGTASVTARLAATSASFEVDVANPDPSKSTLTFEPNSVVAGDQAALATLWAKDSQGRNLAGLQASITADEPNVFFSPSTLRTRGSGKDVCSVLAVAAKPHVFAFDAQGLQFKQTLNVLPAGIDLVHSTVVIAPTTPLANGAPTATVQVQVRDEHDNPISGIAIQLSSFPTYTSLTAPEGVTDADGSFLSGLSSTAAGAASVVVRMFPKSASHVSLRTNTLFVVSQ